jgi:zinc protease
MKSTDPRSRRVKYTLSLVASVACFACTFALAQGASGTEPTGSAGSLKTVQLKNKAPVNPQTLRVVLPKPQQAVLSNGLRIALLEDHELPTVSMQLLMRGGGLVDPADKRGLAMVTAALLKEGTQQRSSREIAEQLATLGASLSTRASPSSPETAIAVSSLSEHFDAVLALAADIVLNPAFAEDELGKFKARYLAQLRQQRSQPGFVAQEQFMRAVYGEHPARWVVPAESVLQGLTRTDLLAYHAAHYKPNNAMVIVHGDITLKDLVRRLERTFGSWVPGQARAAALPPLSQQAKNRVFLIDRPGSVQTSLWLGALGIERNSEDYFAVLVMNHVLGGGPASRLFMNLREDKGYTYGASSQFSGSVFPGVMVAVTDVRTAVTAGAMHELMAEIARIGSDPVSEQELKNAKRALVGRFALSLDAPQALMANLATQKLYELPENYWDTYPQRVEAVTAADIQRVARKYFAADRLQIVAVGDGAQVRQTLEKYGEIEAGG